MELVKMRKEVFKIEDGVLIDYETMAEHVVIPEGVTTIKEFAFVNAPEVYSITLPKSLKHIEDNAFLMNDILGC